MPKRDLIVGLQVLLQAGLEDGPALVREMAEVRVKVTSGGREQCAA